MTDDDWKDLERRAVSPFFMCEMEIYGFIVHIQRMRIDKAGNRTGLVVYVGGALAVKNLIEDCAVRRRFYRPVVRFKYSKKFINNMGEFKKKHLKSAGIDLSEKRTQYRYYWTNFKAMRRHFEKNNTDISLVEGKS